MSFFDGTRGASHSDATHTSEVQLELQHSTAPTPPSDSDLDPCHADVLRQLVAFGRQVTINDSAR